MFLRKLDKEFVELEIMDPQKTIGLLNLWFAVERKHLGENAYLPVSGNGVKDEALACYAGGLGSIPVVPHVGIKL